MPTWRRLSPVLVVPGLVVGMPGYFALQDAYVGLFGDEAAGQLVVPALAVLALAAVLCIWVPGRWFAGGMLATAGLSAAGLFALYLMFPSTSDFTDEKGAEIAAAHLDWIENTPEFTAHPDGLTRTGTNRRDGCSDWFDLREPVTWITYSRGQTPVADIVAFFRRRWEAGGYHGAPSGNMPNYFAWEREQNAWTARLSVFVDGDVVEVAAEDTDSHACFVNSD